ncbi:type I polyketide synthase [Frankia sp. AvcI1]|uniref:type I polyketide synthase n=1 Tax=Frankia sp. AvcI1 TaxID=573496 RepID=UPI0021178333|nr:type I polyketide synthase [Frankia sp. AvcI1]
MSGAATDIAVVGMSCRFPGVRNPAEFWRLLVDGGSTIGRLPEHRAPGPQAGSHPDAVTVTSGSFLDSVDTFDAEFFSIGSAEAAAMDPVQRLGLELAWEAVEDARIAAPNLAGREIDVLVGAASSGYDVLRRLTGSDRDDHYAAIGSSGALIANRISGLLDLRGLSLCADSGQSSSLVSLALACDRIRGGATDAALVGGVNLIVDPEAGLGIANLGVLSPEGRCSPFDERAGGYVRGEGGVFVLLKRLDLALADGDRIYATVRGWGVGNGGASARMPDPSPQGQAAAVLSALRSADVAFDGIDYVEAHGTGTRRGDPAELAGLREVFRQTGRGRPLVIGSAKANVGHLEPAAGIVGFVKAVLCLRHAHLVPTPNFRSPNPDVADFDRDFEVLCAARPWPEEAGRPRRAGVSAFGMGGTVAHVVLDEACGAETTPGGPRPSGQVPDARAAVAGPAGVQRGGVLPWVLSARSEPALREQAARLRAFVAADSSLSDVDVAASLVSTRALFEHRAVVLGGDRAQLLAGLDGLAAGEDSAWVVRGVADAAAGPVVLVFPGQGSQWEGMGRRLYAESKVFAQGIDDCAQALAPWVDWSLVDVVTGADSTPWLDRVDVVQPMLFALMVSLARVWQSWGVVPDVVAGHSQGEMAAACVAGAIPLADAARLVVLRSQALRVLSGLRGGMCAVSAPLEWVRGRLERWPGRLGVGAVNGPSSVVVSGDGAALDEFAALAAAEGVRAGRVRIDYASHSHHVDSVRDQMLADTATLVPRATAVEFHSTVTGGPLDTQALDGSYWYDNLRSPVLFGAVIERLMRERGGVFVEVGPHPLLTVAMAETADALVAAPPVVATLHKDDPGVSRILESLAELHVRGVPVNWDAVIAADRPRRVDLPTYPFQRRRHWLTAGEDAGAAPCSAAAVAVFVGAAASPSPSGPATPERSAAAAGLDSESAVLRLVCAETAAVLGRRGAGPTGAELAARATDTFKDLGFDSAMAVRLRNRLTAAAGVRLSATAAFSHPTPHLLGRHIHALLQPAEPDLPETPRGDIPETEAGDVSEACRDSDLYELIDRGYV